MKKIGTFFLSVLLLTVFLVLPVSASAPTITVSSAEAAPGETITVNVAVSNNPGINSFTLGFSYDESLMSLKNVAIAPELGGQFTYAKKAVWLNNSDSTYNGNILTLTFEAANQATGSSSVTVFYDEGEIINLNEEDVIFAIIPGTVTFPQTEDVVATWSNYHTSILTENDARIEGEVSFNQSVTFTECGFYLAKGDAELKKVAKHDTVTTDMTGNFRWVGYTMSNYYGKLEANTAYRYQFYVIADGIEYKSDIQSLQIGIVVPDDLGDVDGNGEIESADARLALRASVKLEDIDEGSDAFRAADMDGNGAIESSDARLILRLSVKLESMEELKAVYGQ